MYVELSEVGNVSKEMRQLRTVMAKARGVSVIKGLEKLGAEPAPVFPLEQIKGDLARSGWPGAKLEALDVEAGRVFFVNADGDAMYAEITGPETGYAVTKVGSHSEIAKEYDPVDLEDEPRSDVVTGHEERTDQRYDEPGFVPSGTPGEKPLDPGENWEGESLGGVGWGTEDGTPNEATLPDELRDKVSKATLDLQEVGKLVRKTGS